MCISLTVNPSLAVQECIQDRELQLANGQSVPITAGGCTILSRCRRWREKFKPTDRVFPFLDGDVPLSPSYGIYISQLIRFARVCSHVDDFNNTNTFLTSKLLKQGYRYH